MRLLSVTSEMHPLVKTGGLADVAGALPAALAGQGVEVTTVLPGYGMTGEGAVAVLDDVLGHEVRVVGVEVGGARVLRLCNAALFDRPGGPYADETGADHADNWLRFAVFAKAASLIALGEVDGYGADVVHAHDWQAALVPAYLRYGGHAAPPCLLTIHNIAFQGLFPHAIFGPLGLPAYAWSNGDAEYWGQVSFLKCGLVMADAITTVSPTYAREIQTPAFGMGLEGLMAERRQSLHGIVNGIDAEAWNPESDPHLAQGFTARTLKRRAANKKAVQARFGLAESAAPLAIVVSRLTTQKGIDLILEGMDQICATGMQLAILGSGDPALEAGARAAAARHPGQVGLVIGYDEGLSHLMQGGGDIILVPSRFEPCGLTQLYGLRYGCVPLVNATGGLADTVIAANPAALAQGVATGFVMAHASVAELVDAVGRAARLYADPKAWAKIQRNGMAADLSWSASARDYAALYQSLLSPEG